MKNKAVSLSLFGLLVASLACSFFNRSEPTEIPPTPRPTSTPIPLPTIQVGDRDPNEPVIITGTIPFTSPFFINSIAEPFVLLEDEAGFVARDKEFIFPLSSQVIGPVELVDDTTLSYTLPLPSIPTGTLVDIDQNETDEQGVMVFAIAYWSNTWGDPFLEERDGTGWSNAYTSAITDPNREDEIMGGTLLIWSPDDTQGFPSGFGDDDLLFTEDDPITTVPAGYSIVNLDQTPFEIYKEQQPNITLLEGQVAVNDYSGMDYESAFNALFEKASREYPFTEDKGVDWDTLFAEFSDRAAEVRNDDDFYRLIRDFGYAIPDAHIGVSFNADVFFEERGGGLGLVVTELTNGEVIASQVLSGYPAARAGIAAGAEILTWNDLPASDAIRQIQPYFGPFSTEHHRRLEQANFLTRMPPDTQVTLTYRNPGQASTDEVTLVSEVEYDSLFATIPSFSFDLVELPIEGYVMEDVGLAYIKITTFSDDYNLLARVWERYISNIIDNEIPGLIIDLRANGGGSGGLALDFAEYVYDESFEISKRLYYNEITGQFEEQGPPARIEPGLEVYNGVIALLVSPNCISACEGFAHAMTHDGRSIVVGHYPTAGAYGEVGRGQYDLPGGLSLQFPTGRPETPGGDLLIEGVGIIPDILVPVTVESALGTRDVLLDTAIDALLNLIQN